MSKVSVLAMSAMLLFAPVASAQEAPTKEAPAAETRVRVTQPSGLVSVGTLQSLSPDSIVFVDQQGKATGLALQNIELERSLGRTGNFWKTFGITVGSAALIGAVISVSTWEPCVSDEFLGCLFEPESRSEAALLGIAVGGVIAIPVGALLGALIKTERWERMNPVPK